MTRFRGYGKCEMRETGFATGHYRDIEFVRSDCHDRPFDSKFGGDNFCPACGMENVCDSHFRKREDGLATVSFDWNDDEDGVAFRCGRCDEQTIMLDGEPPFYCPRCGVGFTAYMCMGRRYPFRDDGTVDYGDGANR